MKAILAVSTSQVRRGGGTVVVPRPRASWAAGHMISTRLAGTVYRRRVPFRRAALIAATTALVSCTTVDPGPNFVVPDEQFDADFFFCKVEPELLIAKKCGPGDGSDPANGCHFNSSAVSGMAIAAHPTIDCVDNRPTNRAQVGAGSAAQGNLQAVSLVMSRDYATAPIYLRPTGSNHPRAIFAKEDPVVDVLRQWAQR